MTIILIALGGLLTLGVAAVLTLPAITKGMGLHPDYTGQRYILPEGRALIIATNHDQLGEDGRATGVFGSELTAPYYEFLEGRMYVDVASIQGGKIPFDPQSFRRLFRSEYEDRFDSDPVLQARVQNSLRIGDLDFTEYDVIFLAGGWGAAYDLGYSEELGQKISEGYAAGAVVGGVCHGLLGLLNATDENGDPLVEGRRITAVTDKQVEELRITITPQHPETELRAAGANFESSTAFRDIFANHVVVDGRVVSGQNQNAGPEVANLMIKVAGGTRR
ncbi:type 1 glutamine amidotransferase domain-containing protein [Candidatus Bipolaricaulota bacterium]|nr:type 1 glutamine amidotransferase domain-containing protein [Candidatus Bipolaricaulota bacterium]